MVKKKICLVGESTAGKTSLVRKFVYDIFSENYLSGAGIKIDQKDILLESGQKVSLLIWDLEGHKVVNDIMPLYLKGMSGYFLVADGTSKESLKAIMELTASMSKNYPDIPSVCIINKADLMNDWVVSSKDLEFFAKKNIPVVQTSAKTGSSVGDAFKMLAQKLHQDNTPA